MVESGYSGMQFLWASVDLTGCEATTAPAQYKHNLRGTNCMAPRSICNALCAIFSAPGSRTRDAFVSTKPSVDSLLKAFSPLCQ
jgi:hypothetical protein